MTLGDVRDAVWLARRYAPGTGMMADAAVMTLVWLLERDSDGEKDMTKLDNLLRARENLEAQLILREEIAENFGTEKDAMVAEELRGMIYSIRWAERICRAALVVAEERTPDGVSETLIDELVKAARG